jgi:hypothetical protein
VGAVSTVAPPAMKPGDSTGTRTNTIGEENEKTSTFLVLTALLGAGLLAACG